jgi:hypothetical protein
MALDLLELHGTGREPTRLPLRDQPARHAEQAGELGLGETVSEAGATERVSQGFIWHSWPRE